MLAGDDGANINGPSLIRAPDWLPGRLGKYYLYFAHHNGQYIRLAYANELAGPWSIYEPGTLRIEQCPCERHIASPDVHIDEAAREIRMYYHGCRYDADGRVRQFTFLATSADGINFTNQTDVLGDFYFRVFRHGGWHYAYCLQGKFCRSRDGLTPFADGPRLLQPGREHCMPRHAAVQLRGDRLKIFYSRWGDCPERILLSEIDLRGDWMSWQASEPVTVLAPEADYEGADAPHEASSRGKVIGPAWQLRDPGIYEEDGRTYLLYSVAGESGIAIAELVE
jgi:hypothetical protein